MAHPDNQADMRRPVYFDIIITAAGLLIIAAFLYPMLAPAGREHIQPQCAVNVRKLMVAIQGKRLRLQCVYCR